MGPHNHVCGTCGRPQIFAYLCTCTNPGFVGECADCENERLERETEAAIQEGLARRYAERAGRWA